MPAALFRLAVPGEEVVLPESRSWDHAVGWSSTVGAVPPGSAMERRRSCQSLPEADFCLSHPRYPTIASHWPDLTSTQLAGKPEKHSGEEKGQNRSRANRTWLPAGPAPFSRETAVFSCVQEVLAGMREAN